MWPFTKKDKPILNLECDNWAVRKYAPVRPSREFSPPKWDQLDTFVNKQKYLVDSMKTVKTCPGILDYLGLGYVIPAWCDMEITPSDDNKYAQVRYSDPRYKHAMHHTDQLRDFLSEKFQIRTAIKLDNPWRLWTAKGYSLLYLPMYYWPDRNWEAVPGVVDSDLGALVTPINIMLKEPKETFIAQGEPLVQIVPFKRELIVAESRALTSTAIQRNSAIVSQHSMTFKGWMKYMKEKKEYKIDAKDLDLPE